MPGWLTPGGSASLARVQRRRTCADYRKVRYCNTRICPGGRCGKLLTTTTDAIWLAQFAGLPEEVDGSRVPR
jgi:hypothetical protein